jgi:hypothetical protein
MIVTARSSNAINVQSNTTTEMEVAVNNRSNKRKKVDNTQGGGDAVVRLYRDGRKPAARSMFVKNGDSFTAEAVAPGAYRLRYRYIGSADTFEAEETFTLTETRTETGTRFSRMTVMLYQVANGNMAVKKVDASEF